MVKIATEDISAAYKDVRDDKSDTNWLLLKYSAEGDIVLSGTGTEWAEFRSKFADDERAYGYLRQITGEETSKRPKFTFITWFGRDVPALKQAKTATEKILVKNIIANFAVECTFSGDEETDNFTEEHIRDLVAKVGAASYT